MKYTPNIPYNDDERIKTRILQLLLEGYPYEWYELLGCKTWACCSCTHSPDRSGDICDTYKKVQHIVLNSKPIDL